MSSSPVIEQMIGAKEAADIMNCSERSLKNQAAAGKVPAMRMGNRWMFLPSVLDDWRKKQLMSNCSKHQQEEGAV